MSLVYDFFFNDTPTTEIYTLSLHDALPISQPARGMIAQSGSSRPQASQSRWSVPRSTGRVSEAGRRTARRRACPFILTRPLDVASAGIEQPQPIPDEAQPGHAHPPLALGAAAAGLQAGG